MTYPANEVHHSRMVIKTPTAAVSPFFQPSSLLMYPPFQMGGSWFIHVDHQGSELSEIIVDPLAVTLRARQKWPCTIQFNRERKTSVGVYSGLVEPVSVGISKIDKQRKQLWSVRTRCERRSSVNQLGIIKLEKLYVSADHLPFTVNSATIAV